MVVVVGAVLVVVATWVVVVVAWVVVVVAWVVVVVIGVLATETLIESVDVWPRRSVAVAVRVWLPSPTLVVSQATDQPLKPK